MPATQEPRFTTQGPKRRRRTRRELPGGQARRWGFTETHFKREREAAMAAAVARAA